ncbi:MAG: PadR family transcriptional regulator [Archangium sp.]|nr:PadR family transcriptional regulator [Archangium sp.]
MINRTARVILGLLRQSPESIWSLKATLRRKLAHLWTESDGQLYPAVKSLLAVNLISAGPPENRRERTPLRITEAGLRVLRGWLRENPKPDTPRDELALRISLLTEAADADTFRHLDEELQRSLHIADLERALLGAPGRHMLMVSSFAAHWLARRWVILHHDARAAWCREVITHLREIAHPDLNPLMNDPPPKRSEPDAAEMEAILALARRGELPADWDDRFRVDSAVSPSTGS